MAAKMHKFTSLADWRATCKTLGYEIEPLGKNFDNAIVYNADRTRHRVMGQWRRVNEYGNTLWGNSPITSAKNTGWLHMFKNPIRF